MKERWRRWLKCFLVVTCGGNSLIETQSDGCSSIRWLTVMLFGDKGTVACVLDGERVLVAMIEGEEECRQSSRMRKRRMAPMIECWCRRCLPESD
ncbi:hypothetical protein PIB30_063600, partial [Stylosanthes scabra]|nr:hypothetical protein [Stylosanthes scabra]